MKWEGGWKHLYEKFRVGHITPLGGEYPILNICSLLHEYRDTSIGLRTSVCSMSLILLQWNGHYCGKFIYSQLVAKNCHPWEKEVEEESEVEVKEDRDSSCL